MPGELTVDEAWAHWDAMVAAARSVLRNRDAATECAMQAVVQVLEKRPVAVANPEAFLVTVAKRRAVDAVRRDVRARRAMLRAGALEQLVELDVAEGVCDRLEAAWLDATARHALDPQVYALLGQIADGCSVADAAALLGMSTKAAESHLVRARRLLRGSLARALAVVLGTLAALRKALVPAVPAVALSALATVVTVVGQPGLGAPSTALVPDVETVVPRTVPAGHAATASRATHPVAASPVRHRSAQRATAPPKGDGSWWGPERTIVSTPVASVGTQEGDDGHQSSGPVDYVTHCLETLSLGGPYIGCY